MIAAMSAPSCTYGSIDSSTFGSPPQTRLVPAEALYYLEEGLEGVKRHQYRSVRSFITTISKQIKEFQFGGAAQYAVYSPVSDEEFTKIDNARERDLKGGLKFLYLTNERVLIVKFIVSIVHEVAHRRFVWIFMRKAVSTGFCKDFTDIGRTRFSGIGSEKEADTSLIPTSRTPGTGWPTVVFECGVLESLERQRVDARWWLENSKGEVGTAIVVATSKQTRSLHVEIWELVDMPDPDITRANPDPFITGVVTKTGEGDIVGEVVTGAPLKISFKKTMLRDPDDTRGEHDFVFDEKDFKEVAQIAWAISG